MSTKLIDIIVFQTIINFQYIRTHEGKYEGIMS